MKEFRCMKAMRCRDDSKVFARLLDFIPHGILLLTMEGEIDHANKVLTDALGYLQKDLIGRPYSCLIPLNEMGRAMAGIERALMDVKTPGMEFHIRRKSGEYVRLYVEGVGLYAEDGAIHGILCVIPNVAEQVSQSGDLEEGRRASSGVR